jgi:hypothetical protein
MEPDETVDLVNRDGCCRASAEKLGAECCEHLSWRDIVV